MSSIIRVLSDHTINQIAAGEVIENPSSVVKELVENALDAKATQITVEIKGGGHQLIRVVDNGSGMSKEDAKLSLTRHATSKISDAADLNALLTMGFRGEALASIAAVSRLTMISAIEDGQGICIEVEGGKTINTEPRARIRGTTVEVRSLFYNVPARRKFQKAAPISSYEINRLLIALSLSYPEVEFQLINQDKVVFNAPVFSGSFEEKLQKRIHQTLGDEYIASSFEMRVQDSLCEVTGFVGSPLYTRPNRLGQYLFINRRAVVSPLISYGVRDGYGTRIDANRHPLYVLHLNIRHDLVDVNVHPQKKEVRLREERLIKEKIQEAVSSSLQRLASFPIENKSDLPFAVFKEEDNSHFPSNLPSSFPHMPPTLRFKDEVLDIQKKSIDWSFLQEKEEVIAIGLFENYLLLDGKSVANRTILEKPSADGILLVDLKAAFARVSFEALLKGKSNIQESQGLLIPITCDFSLSEAEQLLAHLAVIEEVGFSIRAISSKSFIIDAIPSFMEAFEVKDVLLKILNEGCLNKESLKNEKMQKLALITCQFAKANKKRFVLQEALQLFEELMVTPCPYQCPYGKPTMVHLSAYEIGQFFSAKKK